MRGTHLLHQSALKWFSLSTLVGLVAGLGAVVFYELSHQIGLLFLGHLAGYQPIAPRGESGVVGQSFDYTSPSINPYLCLLLPTLGGLLVGFLCTRYAPEAKGHGTDGAIEAYHRKRGIVRTVVIWVKTLASALTLGTGGSGGREGPIAQIGAGFGSWLGQRLGLSVRERRVLLAVGIGAGIAAIFRAPLAGALFAAEILYSQADFEAEVVMPSIVGSVTSYTIFTVFMGQGTLFSIAASKSRDVMVFNSPLELVGYTVLALLLVVLVRLYVKVFYGVEHLFERIKMPASAKPALGGFLTGLLALLCWWLLKDGRVLNLLGYGYSAIQEAIDYKVLADPGATPVPWHLVAIFGVIALGKLVTTSLTISSGGSAGVFGPSMVIGGCAATSLGLLIYHLWPAAAPHPGAYTIVGMAGFFAGVANVPISTLIMVSEVTGNYHLLLPAMWVEAITFSLCRGVTIYRAQVKNRLESPAHKGDFIVDLLEGLHVRDLESKYRKPTFVSVAMPLREVIRLIDESRGHYFPVTDGEGRMVGIFSTNDIRRYLHDEPMWNLLVAADIMMTKVLTVTPDTDLNTALRRFTERNINAIPVVQPEAPTRVVGLLRHRDVIALYNTRMAKATEEKLAKEEAMA